MVYKMVFMIYNVNRGMNISYSFTPLIIESCGFNEQSKEKV